MWLLNYAPAFQYGALLRRRIPRAKVSMEEQKPQRHRASQ